MAADKPRVDFSLKSIIDEVRASEPVKVALSNSRIITFVNPYDMQGSDAAELVSLLSDFEMGGFHAPDEIFSVWLSKDDFEKLALEKLTLKQQVAFIEGVMSRFSPAAGDAGEDDASQN
ncbi:MAG: hypothetical protein LBE25_13420 [Arthrobacter sp.]|jgi:hypothetical protein|nr:hypothetical protein [Arthrobacter sp.]